LRAQSLRERSHIAVRDGIDDGAHDLVLDLNDSGQPSHAAA
jgi:hypothetical protein